MAGGRNGITTPTRVKILVDMNLSPDWVMVLKAAGWEAVHWSTVGNPRAVDAEIMKWARQHDFVVFTHDLDFGALLAHSRAGEPSVLQVRTQDVATARAAASALRQEWSGCKPEELVDVARVPPSPSNSIPEPRYSCRSATMGSRCAARTAG